MADAGDLKSPARNGRVGSTPTSASISQKKHPVGLLEEFLCFWGQFRLRESLVIIFEALIYDAGIMLIFIGVFSKKGL